MQLVRNSGRSVERWELSAWSLFVHSSKRQQAVVPAELAAAQTSSFDPWATSVNHRPTEHVLDARASSRETAGNVCSSRLPADPLQGLSFRHTCPQCALQSQSFKMVLARTA